MTRRQAGGESGARRAGAAVEQQAEVTRRLAAPAGGTTRAGLPVRVPAARLVPGAVGGSGPDGDDPPAPERSPDTVRGRLAAYQQGARRGRRPTG